MVSLTSLWLPILLSAVLVFITSSVIHMVLKYHKNDYDKTAQEDAILNALQGVPPGEYVLPFMMGPESAKDPVVKAKLERGPRAMVRVMADSLGTSFRNALIGWFIYALVVGLFVAYLTGRALGPGVEYLEVFRFAGTTAFLGYGLAMAQESVWFGRRWSNTLRALFDALIYGLLTAGVFGWLWPK
jgi:hypothetical protein